MGNQLRFIVHTLSFLLSSTLAFGQEIPKATKSRISFLPVPTIGYSPETKTYIGAVCQLGFKTRNDSTTRISSSKVELQFTQNKQVVSEWNGNIYTPGEKWYITFNFHGSRFPDYWWGIGIHTPESAKELFTSDRCRLEASSLKSIRKNWFVGPMAKMQWLTDISFNDTKTPTRTPDKQYSYIGGAQLLFDSRDNMLNPTKGKYLDIQATVNKNTGQLKSTGMRFFVEGRQFFKIGKTGILANRAAFSKLTTETYFFDLSFLGGDRWLRGYYQGRFRDQGMYVLNTEYRQAVYRRWGFAIGAGAGSVFKNTTDITRNPIKPAINLGLRFLADRTEKINMRVDYAMGLNGQTGFYFAFGEAF